MMTHQEKEFKCIINKIYSEKQDSSQRLESFLVMIMNSNNKNMLDLLRRTFNDGYDAALYAYIKECDCGECKSVFEKMYKKNKQFLDSLNK